MSEEVDRLKELAGLDVRLFAERLIECFPDAVIISKCDSGEVVVMNSQAEFLLDYDRKDVIGRPVEMLIPERLREQHRKHRENFSLNPTPRAMGYGMALYCLRKNGKEIPVEIALGPMPSAIGTLVVVTIRRTRVIDNDRSE